MQAQMKKERAAAAKKEKAQAKRRAAQTQRAAAEAQRAAAQQAAMEESLLPGKFCVVALLKYTGCLVFVGIAGYPS